MKKNHLILVSFVLTAVLLCALSVSAQDADAPLHDPIDPEDAHGIVGLVRVVVPHQIRLARTVEEPIGVDLVVGLDAVCVGVAERACVEIRPAPEQRVIVVLGRLAR